jgi:hypothetical protein
VESYIVRVYHRDQQDPTLMKGVVEIVESGVKRAFHESEELWRILASTEHVAAARAEKPARPGTGSRRPKGSATLITTTLRKPT